MSSNEALVSIIRSVCKQYEFPSQKEGNLLVEIASRVRRETVEEIARLCDAEARHYADNAELCDKSHGHFSANNDLQGQLACERMAREIRRL